MVSRGKNPQPSIYGSLLVPIETTIALSNAIFRLPHVDQRPCSCLIPRRPPWCTFDNRLCRRSCTRRLKVRSHNQQHLHELHSRCARRLRADRQLHLIGRQQGRHCIDLALPLDWKHGHFSKGQYYDYQLTPRTITLTTPKAHLRLERLRLREPTLRPSNGKSNSRTRAKPPQRRRNHNLRPKPLYGLRPPNKVPLPTGQC